MEYLRQNTDIPIPRVHSWGLIAESPQHLGPFIIMDYVDGTLLSTILKQPDQENVVLNPNIDNTTLDKIYDQIAYYMFQLS
jgi:aminoglycoside phosphotransferase (APT) family kinase protein